MRLTSVAAPEGRRSTPVEQVSRQRQRDHRREGDRGPAQLGHAAVARPQRPGDADPESEGDRDGPARAPRRCSECRSRDPAVGRGHGATVASPSGSDALTRRDYPSPPFGMARAVPTLGYTPPDIQSAYSLCIQHRGAPCRRARRGSPGIGPSRTSSPSCPGRRLGRTSSSTRRGPRQACRGRTRSCPVRGDGLVVEDIDGNLFLDFAAGIAVNSTGHSHPQVVAAIKEQASELIHFSASRLLPADLPGGLPRAGPHRADLGPRPGLSRQLRDRGRRGVDQARPVRDQAAVHRRLPRRLPRPDLRLGLADRLEGEVPRRLRAAAAGHLPRAVRAGRGPRAGSTRSCSTSSPRPTRSRRSSSSRSRAKAATSSPRTASSRASARSATSTASCSSPTRSSRAPGGPGRCGRSSTGASSRTSC